jgi:hypothetical protein
LTQAERDDITGHLSFIRGLAYFDLVRLFGGVPLRTTPAQDANELNIARSSIDDIYDQIIADLETAENGITGNTAGMASAASATALLARVYLYREQYEMAINKASEVIGNTQYELLGEYEELFSSNNPNKESLFEVRFNEQDRTVIAQYFAPTSMGGRKEISPSDTLIGSFEEGDERFISTVNYSEEQPYGYKYRDINTGTDRIYVLRLAEMYLIRAEARTHLQGDMALINADINKIRERAKLEALDLNDYNAMLVAIEKENQCEFAFEGHRWFDLVRTGRAIEVIPTVLQEYQTLYPVPLDEILYNDKINQEDQNPGY